MWTLWRTFYKFFCRRSPVFFGFLTSTTFARKKRTKFHHFIEFIECFYLNLQSILIRLYGYLSRIYPALEFQVKTVN